MIQYHTGMNHHITTDEMDEYKQREYKEYLDSWEWKEKRKLVLSRARWCCERCGKSPDVLEVHHLTYKNIYNEPLEDLQALCQRCHVVADRERRAAAARESESRFWAARVYGWSRKVYGGDVNKKKFSELEKEFRKWLKKKGYK